VAAMLAELALTMNNTDNISFTPLLAPTRLSSLRHISYLREVA
jgi:hypothetical protein